VLQWWSSRSGVLTPSFARGALPLVCACAATTAADVSDADIWRGRAASAVGAREFAVECAHCHGGRGEGVANMPAVLGPGALPVYPRELATDEAQGLHDPQEMEIATAIHHPGLVRREPFRTGGDLFQYLMFHVRKPVEHDFHEDDYAAIVGFMLAVQGSPVPAGGSTPDNVQSIPIVHR
jgi:hypothetical protein